MVGCQVSAGGDERAKRPPDVRGEGPHHAHRQRDCHPHTPRYHRPGIVLATRERVSLHVVHSIGQLRWEARAIT